MTSIKSIYNYLSLPTNIEMPILEEWAVQALDLMDIKTAFEPKFCTLKVENHSASLPTDVIAIELVAMIYCTGCTQAEIEDAIFTEVIHEYTDTTKEITVRTVYDSNPIPNLDRVTSMNYQAIVNNYKIFVQSPLFINYFNVLRLVNKPYSNAFHCTYSPNISSDCYDYYNINSLKQIITSKKDGIIALSYLARVRNEDGDIMIPDEAGVKQAIAAYVKMRYWEERMNTLEKGAGELYTNWLNQWTNLRQREYGKAILRGADMGNLRTIMLGNLVHARNKLNWDNDYKY